MTMGGTPSGCLKPGQLVDKVSWVETGGDLTTAMALRWEARTRGWDPGGHGRSG